MNIIEKTKALNLPLGQYVVFGSGPMAVHGIRKCKDVDLLVTYDLYRQLRDSGWELAYYDEDGQEYLVKDGIYEADDRWQFGSYNPSPEEIIAIAELHDGVPFAPLTEVMKWKQAFGRPKDFEDIKLIEAYLQQ